MAINCHSKTCSYGEDTLCLSRQSASELAYNGSDTSGLENPRSWMGQALRFAPLPSAYPAGLSMHRSNDRISPRRFKCFPSLAGFVLRPFPAEVVIPCARPSSSLESSPSTGVSGSPADVMRRRRCSNLLLKSARGLPSPQGRARDFPVVPGRA